MTIPSELLLAKINRERDARLALEARFSGIVGADADLRKVLGDLASRIRVSRERVESLEADYEAASARIEQIDRVAAGDRVAFAERITGVSAEIAGVASSLDGKIVDVSAGVSEVRAALAAAELAVAVFRRDTVARFGDVVASVVREELARADADEALARDITALLASVNDNSAAILREVQARADAVSAETSLREAAVSSLNSAISAETAARIAGDVASTAALNSFAGDIGRTLANIVATLPEHAAMIVREETTRVEADLALTNTITTQVSILQGQINDRATIAALSAEATTRANAISAETTARNSAISAVTTAYQAADSALQGQIDVSAAAIVTEQTTRATADEALARDIAILSTVTNDNSAAIIREQMARSDAVSAETSSREAAISAVNSAISAETAARVAAIAAEATTRVTQLEAVVGTLSKLVTTLPDPFGAILREETTRADADSAETAARSAAISAVTTGYQNADSALSSALTSAYVAADSALQAALQANIDLKASIAALLSEETTRATQTEALARDISLAVALFNDSAAAIATEVSVRAAADTAETNARTSAISAVNADIATRATIASLTTESNTRATERDAFARMFAQLLASTGDQSAAIVREEEVRASQVNGLYARWGVALDINGRVVGRIRLDGTEQSSEFMVDATKFTVWNGSSGVPPFQVVGGQVRVANLTLLNTDISGLGSLATANSVAYGDLTGTKPPSNADVTLSAINGGLNVTGGGITLDAGGAIKGGASNFSTGTGFFLGYEGGQYKFRVGNPSGPRIEWNGTAWTVVQLPVEAPVTAALVVLEAFKSGGNTSLTTNDAYGVIPAGGNGSFTYSWQRVSGDTEITAVSSTSRFTKFTSSGGTDEVLEAYFKCVVTSNGVSVDSDQIRVEFIHGTPP